MKFAEGNLLILCVMLAAWVIGGWLIARRVFALYRRESILIGSALGIVIANWLANVLAQVVDLPYAFWLAALIIIAVGIVLSWPIQMKALALEIKLALPYLGWLLILVFVFTMIGRGLAIFDEFQTIPLVSLMAAGKIPSQFVLNPEIDFGYHYFLLLFAAQIARLGGVFPWLALDLARALVLALTLLLGAMWAYRLTGKTLVAYTTAIVLAFATGSRWLLLLLPGSLLDRISKSVQLTGSGAASGDSLKQAITSNWVIEGGGPIPYPFVFADGISHPYVMTYNGIGVMAVMIMLLLLFIADRRKGILGGIVFVIAFSALALANEVAFGLIYLGFFVVIVLAFLLRRRFSRQPAIPWFWVGVLGAGGVIAILQGGMFTEMAGSAMQRLTGQAVESFYSNAFMFVWPPEVISIHLGRLSLSSPAHILLAAFELGPILLVFPLTLFMGWRTLQRGLWYQAAFWFTGSVGLLATFIVYNGSAGLGATTRILEGFVNICKLAFVPLLWVWSKKKSRRFQIGVVTIGLVAILGGVMHFGISLAAAAKPVATYFITDMDVKILANHWNGFEPDTLVFDPNPVRGVTVLGRYSFSSLSWGERRQEWAELLSMPDPYALHAAGFSYVYYDRDYWEQLDPQYQKALASDCVQTLDRAEGYRSEKDYRKDFRLLLDIRKCRP